MEHSRLAAKTAASLGLSSEEQEALLACLSQGISKEQAIVWLGEKPLPSPFNTKSQAAFQPSFVDRIEIEAALGTSPFHQSGSIYSLDLSSVFEVAPLLFTSLPSHPRILDVCAAPGGKSVLASRMLSPSLLVCNEVIGKRTAALISNLTRCTIPNSVVVSHDVAHMRNVLPHAFDLAIVDAPCSGQSLLARGQKNPGCFHPTTLRRNASRQRRIIATARGLVSEGGYLLYSTCTFSKEENEEVIEWLLREDSSISPVSLPELQEYQSRCSSHPCYRLFPMRGEGAGGFTCMLRIRGEGKEAPPLDLSSLKLLWSSHPSFEARRKRENFKNYQGNRRRGRDRKNS